MLRDLTDSEARAALPLKWGAVPEGTIPAWVAEMDFAPPPAVTAALTAAVGRGMLGYSAFPGTAQPADLDAAFRGFAERHWGWDVPLDSSTPVGDVVAGLRLALDELCPPGPVVVPLPCYPPFRDVVALAGREAAYVGLDPDHDHDDRAAAALDLAAVERHLEAGARTVLLCHPHNPLGRVAHRAELEALRDLVRAHGARVLVDEIHAPLVLPGQERFVPYLSVDPEAVLVTSHSKAFGTPGLHAAQIVLMDPDETRRLRSVPVPANHGHSGLGMVAGSAAWRDSDLWLHALRSRLRVNAEDLGELVAEHLPQARLRPLEATYLAWLDLRAYGVADPAAAALEHGVRLAPGHDYQPGLEGHVRLNIATSEKRLAQVVERLAAALT